MWKSHNTNNASKFNLFFQAKAIDSVLRNPESVFVREKVKTLLFDGFDIDCRQPEDFFANAFCSDVKESWREYRLLKKADDFYTTSFWGTVSIQHAVGKKKSRENLREAKREINCHKLSKLNATDTWLEKYRIRRGSTNISEVGEIVEYNSKKNLSTWKNDWCDAFSGTDGSMFQPFIDKKLPDKLYVTDAHICRRFVYHYESEVKVSGV